MRFRNPMAIRAALVMLALATCLTVCSPVHAQYWTSERAVGGIHINASGMLENATTDDLGRLRQFRAGLVGDIPAELRGATELRKVSLRRLEAAIVEHQASGKPSSCA